MSAGQTGGSGPRKRTPQQRAAIDRRAAHWPRPLSATQKRALKALARGYFVQTNAGWRRHDDSCGSLEYFATQTCDALCRRGLAWHHRYGTAMRLLISPAGRKAARSAA